MRRVLLAYSGSLVTSAAITWLARHGDSEVVTLTLDFGEEPELAAVRERALALGAVRAHVVDAREELVRDYMLAALQAGALQTGHALARPLIARRLVDLARMEMASAVAHGGEPGSDAETALHTCIQSLDPALDVISAARAPGMTMPELTIFGREHGVPAAQPSRYRATASLWGRVITPREGTAIPHDAFTLTRPPDECPSGPAIVEIEFAAGVPVRTNGVEMSLVELIESLETIAGAHGVGRRILGSTAVEAPAATVLEMAHRELEAIAIGPHLSSIKEQLATHYSDALIAGRWFSDARAAIDAFNRVLQARVYGSVRLELLKGRCSVLTSKLGQVATVRRADHSKVLA